MFGRWEALSDTLEVKIMSLLPHSKADKSDFLPLFEHVGNSAAFPVGA